MTLLLSRQVSQKMDPKDIHKKLIRSVSLPDKLNRDGVDVAGSPKVDVSKSTTNSVQYSCDYGLI